MCCFWLVKRYLQNQNGLLYLINKILQIKKLCRKLRFIQCMCAAIPFSCGHVIISSLRQLGFFSLPQLSSHSENVDTVVINRLFSAQFKKQTLYFYDNTVEYTLAYSKKLKYVTILLILRHNVPRYLEELVIQCKFFLNIERNANTGRYYKKHARQRHALCLNIVML